MDKIFLIHDPQRLDRRDLYRKELETQGIDSVEIIPAVKDSSNPIINISRAHKKCIRKALELDLERVIVLEDDLAFSCSGAFNRFLELSDGSNGLTWDIFIGGSYDYQFASTDPPLGYNMMQVSKFSGLFCYIVNRKYYEPFLKVVETTNIDKAISKTGCSVYMAWPQLCLCHDGFSDNTKRQTSYNKDYAQRIKLYQCEKEIKE